MIRVLLKATALSILLLSCSKQTTEEFLNQANSYSSAGEKSDAEITLKNAIKEYPKKSQLRKALGELYLSQGLATLAEKELTRALELGKQDKSIILNLLTSLYMQQKVEDVQLLIESLENPSEEILPALRTYSGIAYYDQNFPSRAKRAFQSALELPIKNKYSILAEAYLASLQNDEANTNLILKELLDAEPKFAEALTFKSRILYSQKQFEESANTLETYLTAYPNAHWARIYYSQSLVRSDQYVKAYSEVTNLLELFPNQPLLNHLKAAIEFESEDFQLAKEYADKSMQLGDNQDLTVFIAGVSSMRLGNNEQAYSYLETLASKYPATHPIQKLFSIVQYKVGYFQEATDSLDSLNTTSEDDFELFSSMSYGLLRAGKINNARELISKAEAMHDGTPESLTRIGQLKLYIDDSSGIGDLVESLELEPNQTQTILLLATAYIQNQQFDKAFQLAKSWQERDPKNVEATNLEAYISYKNGDLPNAVATYKKSILNQPGNFRAHLFIKNALVLEGQFEEAAKQMESYLSHQPNDPKALIHLYLVKKQQQDTHGIVKRIEKILENAANDEIKVVLARVYNSEGHYEKAANLLFSEDAKEGFPSFHWQILTEALINMNDDEKTLLTITRWQQDYPSSIQAIFYKLVLLERQGKLLEATETLAKWNKNRNHNQLLLKEAFLNVKMNRFPEAIASINRVSDNSIYTARARYILGRIAAWSKNHIEAKKLLNESYQAAPLDDTAAWIAEQIKEVDGSEEAISFLKRHLSDSPTDILSRTQLANMLFENNAQEALKQYKTILTYAPENVVALNNLAWDAKQKNELDIANQYADKALKYARHIPAILDTAAAIKLEMGQTETARDLLAEAYKIDTNSNDISFNYIKVLIQLGETGKAKEIIEVLLPNNEQQEAQKAALLDTLSS